MQLHMQLGTEEVGVAGRSCLCWCLVISGWNPCLPYAVAALERRSQTQTQGLLPSRLHRRGRGRNREAVQAGVVQIISHYTTVFHQGQTTPPVVVSKDYNEVEKLPSPNDIIAVRMTQSSTLLMFSVMLLQTNLPCY